MRILPTADLHYQPAARDAYLAFAQWAAAQQPDVFILAGDVGHPLRLFRRGLELFAHLPCPKLLVAGNHDLYAGDHDSRALWEQHLPAIARDEGFLWLEESSWVQNGVAVCGTMAWYDYSSHAQHLSYAPQAYRQLKGMVNHDADYINWPWSDQAMARFLSKRFTGRLSDLETNPQVQQIVVVTHMPIFASAIPEYPESEFWSLLRAYMGNLTLGDVVRQSSKVTHVVSGHIHRTGQWRLPGARGAIDVRLVGSRRGQPQATVLDL